MIEIYLLEQLDAFAKCGTLSAAAEQLHISQPALSRSMKKLEEETGFSLFDRDGRKISLNEGGKIAASYASRILSDEEEMRRQLDDWDRSQRIVTAGSCAPMPITRLLPALQLQFPDKSIVTEIHDSDAELIRRLKADDMQVVILHEIPEQSGIFCQRYLQESICLFVPKDHPLAGKKSVSLEELSQYSILLERHIGFWLPLCREKLPASSLLVQESMDALDELAESSKTAMFNSDAMIKDGYDSGDRIAIPISDSCMHVVYYAACLESKKDQMRTLFNSVRAQALKEM